MQKANNNNNAAKSLREEPVDLTEGKQPRQGGHSAAAPAT